MSIITLEAVKQKSLYLFSTTHSSQLFCIYPTPVNQRKLNEFQISATNNSKETLLHSSLPLLPSFQLSLLPMAEALLGIVIENLGSFVQNQLATYWGVDQQTQKLSSNLTAIRAVLRDAERKQLTSHAVKDWLQKLTDAAYVLDDILDECSIHSTKMHSDDGHTSCLSPLHPKDILFRFNIGKRMKDITQRFQDINEERSMFELHDGVTQKQAVDDEDDDWRQTSSVITEPIFCVRDKDRKKIVKFLLEDASKSEDLSIYPIVGMGGLGKPTLAKRGLQQPQDK